jgi:hypothetical protein
MGTSKLADANRKRKVLQQLGLSTGVARNRLIRFILFDFVQRLFLHLKQVSSPKIEQVEELSIEHKQPWLDIDPILYWDLTNIAFSHLACNRPHRKPGGISQRKISPEGYSWCCGCKDHLPVAQFYEKVKGRWNGYSWQCRKCQANSNKKYKALRKRGVMVSQRVAIPSSGVSRGLGSSPGASAKI